MLKIISIVVLSFISINVTSQPVYPVLLKDLFIRNRPIPPKVMEIREVFVWEDCKHQGNNTPVAMQDLVIQNDYGLIIWWNRFMDIDPNGGYAAYQNINTSYTWTDDFQGIFDCTITVKLGSHDPRIAFQELIFGYLKLLDMTKSPFYKNISKTVGQLDPENTLANRGLKELQAACKDAVGDCTLGCVIIEYGDKVIKSCKQSSMNMGDKFKEFTRDDVRIRILAVGVFLGKTKDGRTLAVSFPPMNIKFRLDFTRLYGGPCYTKQQYYCPTHGVCIRYALACDSKSMYNCPTYNFAPTYDEPNSCTQDTYNNVPMPLNLPDPKALSNLYIFWILLGIFLSLLAYLLLNYCLWRPGYLIWRCGRLRNWCAFGNCCFHACHNCSQSCNTPCCKTQGTFDTTETSTVIWSKYPTGDGFHMRENR